jgi:aerobic-type carbon monoxide dehydrogenase small subunit (CoxS/CutS family)
MDMFEAIRFKLNGKPTQLTVDGERRLLWTLRCDFALIGTKYGCGEGICGACTVLINNKATRSCQVPVKEIKGKEVITIEGLARDGKLHPLQKAFMDHDALQCGFCTPGMIMNAYGLLLEKHQPTEAEIIEGMNDNLCRCGSHVRIVQAIQSAAKEMKGGSKG